MFAQAMSSTSPTAPMRRYNGRWSLPMMASRSGIAPSRSLVLYCGQSVRSRAETVASSAVAVSIVTAGFILATTPNMYWSRFARNSAGMRDGIQNCWAPSGNRNDSGMTPMTVGETAPRVIVRPTIAGSAPKNCLHVAWLRTTTGSASGASSASVDVRPTRARTPSTSSSPPTVDTPRSTSGSPKPTSAACILLYAPMPLNAVVCAFMSKKVPGDVELS
jgi:hypothetical protein